MSDTLAVQEEDKKPIFVSPFNKLDKTTADAMLAASNTAQFSHYLNGAFVDLMQQTRVRKFSNKSNPTDWANVKEDFEWSSDQILTLLDFYSQYPELWDTKHERYMNKEKRKQLITQLSGKIGAPEHAVNVKFQRLRVHFSRELRKEESSVGETHPYQSKWKYYSNMLFLKDTLKCRQRVRQHNQEKDSMSHILDMSSVAHHSDSGNSSPESAGDHTIHVGGPVTSSSGVGNLEISPGRAFDNKENMSPPAMKGKPAPLSPSLITTPFSSLATSLVPPLLSNNPLFSNLPTPLPTPPASLLNSFASLEHLLSPKMLGPLLIGGKGKEQTAPPPPPITVGSLIAPTPQVPNSPLTPNVVCSGAAPGFWKSPHLLAAAAASGGAAKEDEDAAAMKSYQAKRQKILKDSAAEAVSSRTRVRSGIEDCDYFSMHVSESLRKMDILCAEECKRSIQNTIYQYIVKSCQRQQQQHQQMPGYHLPSSYLNIFNSNLAAASPNTTNVRVISKGGK